MTKFEEGGTARAIIVMGVAGSGKSTLAKLLAGTLDCTFLEGDDYHSAANVAKMRRGEPLTDADRWPWLDRLGKAIGGEIDARGRAVAACSALRRGYRDRLRTAIDAPILFVLLEAAPEELARRLANRPGHYMPASLLDSQLATLETPTTDEHAISLPATRPPGLLLQAALARLAEGA